MTTVSPSRQSDTYWLKDVRARIIDRVRSQQSEIETTIFARILADVPDQVGADDVLYMAGLRATVTAIVEYGLAGIGMGDSSLVFIPQVAIEQAQHASRLGVSLETVLSRYITGYKLLVEYVTFEVEGFSNKRGVLAHLNSVQASLLERIVASITSEYGRESARAECSLDHRRAECVRRLLKGEVVDSKAVDNSTLDYELDRWHLGIIANGRGAGQVVHGIAVGLGRELLSVRHTERTVWAWIGGQSICKVSEVERVLSGRWPKKVSLITGEPAKGAEGWRLTHQQAQAALVVALRKPAKLTRYADVALTAAVFQDTLLARSLVDIYLSPLAFHTSTGAGWRETLHAYFGAAQNISQAAAKLDVTRQTVENRLNAIERVLGRPRHTWLVDLAVALRVEQLDNGGLGTPPPPSHRTHRGRSGNPKKNS
jgi:hypothetical protein